MHIDLLINRRNSFYCHTQRLLYAQVRSGFFVRRVAFVCNLLPVPFAQKEKDIHISGPFGFFLSFVEL